MGRDARGFERCACLKERCDCKEFEANHEGRCFYCGHFPSRHTNLTTQAISTAPSTSTSASCSMSAPPPTLATEIARVSKLLAALEPIEPSRVSDAIQTLQKFPDTIFHVSRLASYSNAGQALDELSPIVRPLPVVSTRFATHPCQAVNPRVEGVRTSDIILSRREHKVQQLVSNAFKNGAILVIGPPFCGKTSLAMTLIGSQITNIPIFSTTMLRDGCDNFWSDTNTFLRRRQGLFVMDEVQKAYFSDQSEFMWQTAKSLILEPTPNFAMLLFAVHGQPNDGGFHFFCVELNPIQPHHFASHPQFHLDSCAFPKKNWKRYDCVSILIWSPHSLQQGVLARRYLMSSSYSQMGTLGYAVPFSVIC